MDVTRLGDASVSAETPVPNMGAYEGSVDETLLSQTIAGTGILASTVEN